MNDVETRKKLSTHIEEIMKILAEDYYSYSKVIDGCVSLVEFLVSTTSLLKACSKNIIMGFVQTVLESPSATEQDKKDARRLLAVFSNILDDVLIIYNEERLQKKLRYIS